MYQMIDHGTSRLERTCYYPDSKDDHPGDCDGLILRHAGHDIWTLINIIKELKSQIKNQSDDEH